ncbi:hypothetical protein HK102_000775 [Quaeritorhiza haematococci]|nr:hypothetical protein HK102_000775 [Quaeritorhiza haematococci]
MFLFGTGPQKLVPPANTSAVTSTNRVRGSDDTMAVNSQDNVKGDEPENVEQDSDDDDDDDDIVDEFLKTPMFRRNISSVVPLCLNLMDNLLTWGADPSAVDVFGRTPLHLILQRAGSKGMEEAVQLLVRAGADVDAQEHSGGWSALHLAALYNQTRIVEYLIRMGAKLNQTTSRGVTELHLAARNGNREIITLLVKAGCKNDIKNSVNFTPLDVALGSQAKTALKSTLFMVPSLKTLCFRVLRQKQQQHSTLSGVDQHTEIRWWKQVPPNVFD